MNKQPTMQSGSIGKNIRNSSMAKKPMKKSSKKSCKKKV